MISTQPSVKIERRRVADQILEHLRDQILSGALAHGTKLPPERELAEQYGVSGPTIREAIRALTAMGLVASKNGSGTTVTAQADTLMSVSISSVVQFGKMDVGDVFGLLAVLYSYAAQLAVERATTEEIASLRRAAERAAAVAGTPEGADELRKFHHTLAAIAHHPLLSALCRSIVDIQVGLSVAHAGEKPRSRKRVSGSVGEMRIDVAKAIEHREAARAVELVQAYHQRVVEEIRSARGRANTSDPGTSVLLSSWLRDHVLVGS